MSFAIGSFPLTRERAHPSTASLAVATPDPIAISAQLNDRGDHVTLSLTAPVGAEPSVADVNALLIAAGVPTLSLTSTPGMTRVTVLASSQSRAVTALEAWVTQRGVPQAQRRGGLRLLHR